MRGDCAIVLPVKRFDRAKHRLSGLLSPAERRVLMEAMLGDVLAALARVRTPHELVLVSAEPRARATAASFGARVLDDSLEAGHSEAAALGIAHCVGEGARRVLLLPGDCPLLEPSAVEALLARPAPARGLVGLVADRAGTGTNALLLEPPHVIRPAFGPGSRERHAAAARAGGFAFEDLDVPGLALDVDTADDLAAMAAALDARPGSAPRARAALPELAALAQGAR